MAYGFRSRFSKNFRSSGRGRYSVTARRSLYYKKAVGPKRRLKTYVKRDNEKTYAKFGAGKMEKKYDDDYIESDSWTQFLKSPSPMAGPSAGYVLGGRMARVNNQFAQVMTGVGPTTTGLEGHLQAITMTPNCITNIDSGLTSMTRIGNLVDPQWIRLKGIVAASTTTQPTGSDPEITFNNAAKGDTTTEAADYLPTHRYCRTALKIFIIRDKHMNEKGFVDYRDVFMEPSGNDGGWGLAASQPYLWNRKIDTLDRYQVLKEITFNLDQDDPQGQFDELISLKGYPIKYNGAAGINWTTGQYNAKIKLANGNRESALGFGALSSSVEEQSMTNGIYILGVSFTNGTDYAHLTTGDINSPKLTMSTRLCFEDA